MDGGQIVIFVEGYFKGGAGDEDDPMCHIARRSYPVPSGTSVARVIATFAAFNPGRCRYLKEDNRCGQYDSRPLVCQIYPAEINPYIKLDPVIKDCPSDVWSGELPLILRNSEYAPELLVLIERSRQADRDDIQNKVAICEYLNINISALKGHGVTAWLPAASIFLEAFDVVTQDLRKPSLSWNFDSLDDQVRVKLNSIGATVSSSESCGGVLINFKV